MPVIKEQKVKKSLTKQERDKLRYEQKKENIKAQRKERYQNKKAEQKNVAEQKVNVNTIFVSNPKYACVQKTLTNLKKYLRRGEEFPREKFKNFLLRQNANF
jgi:6-phosphogluconate dehydrogenase (decarboxylating)